MKVWKYTPKDLVMLLLELGQFTATLWLAANWGHLPLWSRAGGFVLIVLMITYSIVVVTHLFTHTPWFQSQAMNSLASMLNSVNIGQSAEAYKLTHVRNHHRYNNDEQGPDGTTQDLSSTYREGINGEHASLVRYAFLGAASSVINAGRTMFSVIRLFRVSEQEHELRDLTSKAPARREKELRQIQLDRLLHFLAIVLYLLISWKWTLLCYVPAFYIALALVNIQNYYEHYGAMPEDRYADSVSYYGRIYNWLTFNDGYHQEHHLLPQAHWTTMPEIRREHGEELGQVRRVVSPVPAIIGFLHRGRPLLHHGSPAPEGNNDWQDEINPVSVAGN